MLNLLTDPLVLQIHPEGPSSFRRQKTIHVPANAPLVREATFPRARRARVPPWHAPPDKLKARRSFRRRTHLSTQPETRTSPPLPCSGARGLPASPTQSTLPHYGLSITWLTRVDSLPRQSQGTSPFRVATPSARPGTGYQPAAVEVPTLVLVFVFEVTSVRDKTHLLVVCAKVPLGHSHDEPDGSSFLRSEHRSNRLTIDEQDSRFGSPSPRRLTCKPF